MPPYKASKLPVEYKIDYVALEYKIFLITLYFKTKVPMKNASFC